MSEERRSPTFRLGLGLKIKDGQSMEDKLWSRGLGNWRLQLFRFTLVDELQNQTQCPDFNYGVEDQRIEAPSFPIVE